ncbi:MAG: DUF2948 family protein [Alphaproteobacteria bacterium]|jgi:hypothetical protein|nr:DUF2948 family protein [Alphaproteobacteria bacterium]
MSDPAPLRKLKAIGEDDLAVISSALQDAIIPIGDISFESGSGQFVFVANRFCWEAGADANTSVPASRINSGVTFSNVVVVKQRGINFRDRGVFLNLLAVTCTNQPDRDGPTIELAFSGDTGIRLETTGLLCHLEDFGEPWPTQWRPQHADD